MRRTLPSRMRPFTFSSNSPPSTLIDSHHVRSSGMSSSPSSGCGCRRASPTRLAARKVRRYSPPRSAVPVRCWSRRLVVVPSHRRPRSPCPCRTWRPRGEGDLVAAQPAVGHRDGCRRRLSACPTPSGTPASASARRPDSVHVPPALAGHDPEAARCTSVVQSSPTVAVSSGVPVFHRERVRHDARAGLEVEDLRPQLQVDVGQQEHRDDGRPSTGRSRTGRPS